MGSIYPNTTSSQQWPKRAISCAPYVVLVIVVILLPPFIPTHIRSMMTMIFIYAILAQSLNLLFGYTGLFSLGHAAYFGVGSYTAAILVVRCGIENFWLVALISILMAVLVGCNIWYCCTSSIRHILSAGYLGYRRIAL